LKSKDFGRISVVLRAELKFFTSFITRDKINQLFPKIKENYDEN
jgi:hypothetical protein